MDHVSSFTCHRSCLLNKRRKRKKTDKNIRNTVVAVLSVLKFVLGNIQRECLSILLESLRIQNWSSMLNLTNWPLMKPSHWLFFCYSKYCIWLKISTYSFALRHHSLRSYRNTGSPNLLWEPWTKALNSA